MKGRQSAISTVHFVYNPPDIVNQTISNQNQNNSLWRLPFRLFFSSFLSGFSSTNYIRQPKKNSIL